MKLLAGMSLSPLWVIFLQSHAVAAEHWSSVGALDATDEQMMAYAAAENFIVLTHDLDFSAILAATKGKKHNVVQISAEDTSPGKIGSQVISALKLMQSELENGALLTVDPAGTRLRLLPLHSVNE
jgi:predicted nuclease of predicted toxin-antitoxin system